MNTTAGPVEPDITDDLPLLTEARISEIESALFADIARERTTRRTRRTRWWLAGGAAAAVLAVAAVISPGIVGVVGGGGGVASTAESADLSSGRDSAAVEEASGTAFAEADAMSVPGAVDQSAGREIIATASASVVVDDTAATAASIADAAEARGGYVESLTLDGTDAAMPQDGITYDTMPYYPGSGSWITVRVPSDQLTDLVDSLGDLGDVTSSQISRQDVTSYAVDLRARIDAAQASVDRLTELMSQTESVADLIAAESALSERQAMLEAYQQELESLEKQIDLSALTVSLSEPAPTVAADPAGFADGLAAGWNGLVATLNGIVIGLGFLLPWIVLAGVIGFAIWAIRRVRRTRRAAARVASERDAEEPERDTDATERDTDAGGE